MSDKIEIKNINYKKDENGRRIKKEINLGEGAIYIYEPAKQEIEEIENFEEEYFKNNSNTDEIDARALLFYLVPKLTNLSFEGLTDEIEIGQLFENPPLYLQLVRQEMEYIINEINNIKVMELRNKVMKLNNMIEQADIIHNLPDTTLNIMENAKNVFDKKTINNLNKIYDYQDKLKVQINDAEKQKKIEELQKQIKELQG